MELYCIDLCKVTKIGFDNMIQAVCLVLLKWKGHSGCFNEMVWMPWMIFSQHL